MTEAREESPCPNCDTPVVGEFCSSCGQRQTALQVPVKRLLAESVSEALNIEGRLFTTLRYLLLRPGLLTSEYSAGRRVRYVAPARLYLLTSVVFGAALVFADNTFVVNMDGPGEEDRVVWMRMWLWSVARHAPCFRAHVESGGVGIAPST